MPTDRTPFKPDIEENPISSQKGHEGPWIEGLDFLSDTNYLKMSQFLGLSLREREDTRLANKIGFLSDWAGRKGNTTDETKKREIIKQLWKDLGITYKGDELIMYLYRYARLDDEQMKIGEEKELYNNKDESPKEADKADQSGEIEALKEQINVIKKSESMKWKVKSLEDKLSELNQKFKEKPKVEYITKVKYVKPKEKIEEVKPLQPTQPLKVKNDWKTDKTYEFDRLIT